MKRQRSKPLSPAFVALFEAMHEALSSPPADIPEAIEQLPAVGTLPSPWTTWLFLSIITYHQRQKWGRQQLRRFLPETVPPSASRFANDYPVEGILPGSTEWEVAIEPWAPEYAILSHRVTRQEIIVDLSENGDHPLLFLTYWNQDRQPDASFDLASRRVLELAPVVNEGGMKWDWRATKELTDNGFLARVVFASPSDCPDGIQPGYFLYTDWARGHEALVLKFLRVWKHSERLIWIAALIGDWLLAHQLAVESADEQLIEATASRADACRERRTQLVKNSIGDSPAHIDALWALRDLQVADLDEYVGRGLRSNGWGLSAVAEFIEVSDDPKWCEEVFCLWRRAEQIKSYDHRRFLGYLIKHRYRTDVVIDMLAYDFGAPDEAALLAMEHSPRRVLDFVRAGLRWNEEEERSSSAMRQHRPAIEVAKILAVIDLPWTRRELLAALSELNSGEPTDQLHAISIVSALGESADEECRSIAEKWKPLLDARELASCNKTFQMTLEWEPSPSITKVWHWRPMEETST